MAAAVVVWSCIEPNEQLCRFPGGQKVVISWNQGIIGYLDDERLERFKVNREIGGRQRVAYYFGFAIDGRALLMRNLSLSRVKSERLVCAVGFLLNAGVHGVRLVLRGVSA